MTRIVIIVLGLTSLALGNSGVDTIINKASSTNKESANIQKKINSYSDKSESLFDKYIEMKRELDEQRSYNQQLSLITSAQKDEIPKLLKQLNDIEITQKKIIPLMFDMVNTLDKLVNADTPFLFGERSDRIQNLKTYLASPEMTLSEQFRMIFEGYKIEYGYARTLEAYRSQLDPKDSSSKTVNFLRVGRVALYYQSLDREESGIYDLDTHKWVKLDNAYNENILKAIQIAQKKVTPDFLTLPILTKKAIK